MPPLDAISALFYIQNAFVARVPPRTPLAELTALPRPPSWWGGGLAASLPKNLTLALGPSGLKLRPFGLIVPIVPILYH